MTVRWIAATDSISARAAWRAIARAIDREPARRASLTLGGRTVEYTLTLSARARAPRLVIAPGVGLRVVAPRGYDGAALLAFVRSKERWILAHLDMLAALPTPPDAAAPLSETLVIAGVPHRVRVAIADAARGAVTQDADGLIVAARDLPQARRALEAWLARRAAAAIAAQVAHWARAMGLTYGRVAIRNQRTRWGSCSSAGNLNFNWRLILAPPEVLAYVVIHELAHRAEMNHSARFWRIVARHCPAYHAHRAWLRTHGASLRC